MRDVNLKKEFCIKFIAYLEIIGGVLGIVMSLIVLISTLRKIPSIVHAGWVAVSAVMCVPLLFLFLFLFTIRAGVLLNKAYIKGYWESMWVQGLQLPVIITPSFSYHFYAGLQLSLGYVSSSSVQGFQFRHQLGSYFWLQFQAPVELYGFFINIIALFCFTVLYIYRPKQ